MFKVRVDVNRVRVRLRICIPNPNECGLWGITRRHIVKSRVRGKKKKSWTIFFSFYMISLERKTRAGSTERSSSRLYAYSLPCLFVFLVFLVFFSPFCFGFCAFLEHEPAARCVLNMKLGGGMGGREEEENGREVPQCAAYPFCFC